LRSVLPQLQGKFREAALREYAAEWEQRYEQVEKIRDQAAEQYAEVPKLMERLIELFRLNEDVTKQCSDVNGSAPSGEPHRLVNPELLARGLQNFSQGEPSIARSHSSRHSPAPTLWLGLRDRRLHQHSHLRLNLPNTRPTGTSPAQPWQEREMQKLIAS
jgi:hypothetical protein